ncbi:hypothetical protein OSB04_004073 [Centaurea solstitialis]|uniref:Uncharacterized protein n=1 Tax=Centaurea solstitialis TaxID=347529 RepID=A0AA38UD08_9ASTR|nr:hypothetical protein OSB04_004073 [Centaurea solstitialis]
MARVRNWYNQSKSATLIWFISLITFYAVFQMASRFSLPSRGNLSIDSRFLSFLITLTSFLKTVRDIFSPSLEKVIWFQNSELYHFSMFHASHHIIPVPASDEEVISGTDPVIIRSKLRNALPRAPGKQLYEPAILHTSLARILGHPNNTSEEPSPASELQYFHELVAHLNNRIRGTKATISELWYVEEYDVLALALDGSTKIRRFQFGCSEA